MPKVPCLLGMGKYMKKGKTSGVAAVMEVSHQSGVRTRARTLAVQRVQRTPPPPPSAVGSLNQDPFSYLELRSRRLEKLIFPKLKTAAAAVAVKTSPSPNDCSSDAGKVEGTLESSVSSEGSVSQWSCGSKRAEVAATPLLASAREVRPEDDAGVEVSFGENALELEIDSCRSARETTQSSLIRDPYAVETPVSTTKSASNKKRKVQKTSPSAIPKVVHVEEFFAVPEQLQQEIFKVKYNFDLTNEEPLAGRYEWVKLDN